MQELATAAAVGDDDDYRMGRFQRHRRLSADVSASAATPKSLSSFDRGNIHAEEVLYKFLAGELNHHLKMASDHVLFIKVLQADGIDTCPCSR